MEAISQHVSLRAATAAEGKKSAPATIEARRRNLAKAQAALSARHQPDSRQPSSTANARTHEHQQKARQRQGGTGWDGDGYAIHAARASGANGRSDCLVEDLNPDAHGEHAYQHRPQRPQRARREEIDDEQRKYPASHEVIQLAIERPIWRQLIWRQKRRGGT